MGHSITAILLKGPLVKAEIQAWDVVVNELPHDIKLVFVDHYYAACWQQMKGLDGWLPTSMEVPSIFPREVVLADLAAALAGTPAPVFAVIFTDYFGGAGDQHAQLYQGRSLLRDDVFMINEALQALGVSRQPGLDEFDTVGLSAFRSNPEALDRYQDMADELGV